VSRWKRRYFVLRKESLSYYISSKDKTPKGLYKLSNAKLDPIERSLKRLKFMIGSKELNVKCSSQTEKQFWLN
jgi:hypothetical protein